MSRESHKNKIACWTGRRLAETRPMDAVEPWRCGLIISVFEQLLRSRFQVITQPTTRILFVSSEPTTL